MYRVLIVDDEMAARETLKCIIDWKKVGFDTPVVANNGKQAWDLYQQSSFDVVFTDIEMPIMNGLKLIENIRQVNPQQKIVIISCHERFDYAKRAIKLNVSDYLIKDLLSAEELYAYAFNLKSEFSRKSPLIPAEPICNVREIVMRVFAGEELDSFEYQRLRDKLGLSSKKSIAAMMIVLDRYDKLRNSQSGNAWHKALEGFQRTLEESSLACLELTEGQFLILFRAEENFSMLNFISHSVGYANSIRNLAEKNGISSISIGISNPASSLEDLLTLREQAIQACGTRVTIGLNKNILYSGIGKTQHTFDKESLENSLKKIKKFLSDKDLSCITQIRRLYTVDLMDGFMEANYFHYINTRLYGLFMSYLESQNLDYTDVFTDFVFDIKEVDQLETAKEMAEYFTKSYYQVIQQESASIPDEENIVHKAIKIIEKNYHRDISLNEIADILHVHKGYLCRVFKEETGENLMQYVVNCKIDKAKELLENTSLKLYEISDQLGFATPQYFSVVFKKQTSVTPNKYKKQVEQKTESFSV